MQMVSPCMTYWGMGVGWEKVFPFVLLGTFLFSKAYSGHVANKLSTFFVLMTSDSHRQTDYFENIV